MYRIILACYYFILLLSYSSMAVGREIDTVIPEKAYAIMPIIAEENKKYALPTDVAFITAAIEQESCISLYHSRCFSPTSRFKTNWKNGNRREEGAGLLMLTRTWYNTGGVRFDTLTQLAKKYRTHLNGLNWKTVYKSPRLQVRAGLFYFLDLYNGLSDSIPACEKQAFMVSAYNQGLGGVKKDRRLCGLRGDCDVNKWFGNVASMKRSYFSTRKLYGNRTAWDINRKHVSNVLRHRIKKYRKYYSKFY